MVTTLYAALIWAPAGRVQGDVQRILYLHVPSAVGTYAAYTLVFIASLMYLIRRDDRWDEVAAAAAEIGTVFVSIVLATGMLWARPIWGTWWTWDARLTSTFVLWLIFVGYLMLRAYGGAPDQVARYCAVVGIIGFLDLPIIHYSVTWWRTLHPEPVIMTQGGLGASLPTSMLSVYAIGSTAVLLLLAVLFTLRLRIERMTRRVDELRRAVDNSEERNR